MNKIYLACGDFIHDYEGHTTKYFKAFTDRNKAVDCIKDIIKEKDLEVDMSTLSNCYHIKGRASANNLRNKFGCDGDRLMLYVETVEMDSTQ